MTMPSPDTLAAAKRLRQLYAAMNHNLIVAKSDKPRARIPYDPPMHEIPASLVRDYRDVCLAYLAEHPADSDEPITDEWLDVIGWREHFVGQGQVGGHLLGRANTGCMMISARVVCLDADDGLYSIEISQHEPDENPCWPNGIGFTVPNRGAVLRLLAALGIDIKEGE